MTRDGAAPPWGMVRRPQAGRLVVVEATVRASRRQSEMKKALAAGKAICEGTT